ncbi:cysteinyl-trna synthetase [Phaffia rhodozyma]|uniref:cysteine--tRNA ligase n=1 Tax=Phaffia rhodozyma TaxID=264483 RepID=A0A0F7SK23_PHARH|nr:cysteinyl-trna synthetase [Phaffia rhodozyma]
MSTSSAVRPESSNTPVIPSQESTEGSAAAAASVAGSKVRQPEWLQPTPKEEPVLKVWNSLTRSKVPFVPKVANQVTWYNCGPTVYDASHMGHARNYVTQDVLRRIMRDYFGYDVHFVMNVTDIDDKIIIRSRQEHLLNRLRDSTISLTPELINQAREAWAFYLRKTIGKALPESEIPAKGQEEKIWDDVLVGKWETDQEWRNKLVAGFEKMTLWWKTLTSSRAAIRDAEKTLAENKTQAEVAQALIEGVSDPLALHLDDLHGSTVTSPQISRALAAHWEKSFLTSMEQLNVLPADTLTRVSEYVPEVVSFVQGIVDRGFAYDDEKGSLYFDSVGYDGAVRKGLDGGEWKHSYAKLAPWSKGNSQLLAEGEGSLTSGTQRHPADFALWKSSKPGEPSWPSPWGQGRPGWHIECSVMASEILGDGMDIHSGGVDLMFPHHDNEIAQSEAFHDCKQWVNYFFHTGHLHIEGLKMSKSLKNFITIDEALAKNTARQLRLGFMLQLWNNKMDFKESTMAEAKSVESSFNNFFTQVKARKSQAEALGESFDGKHYFDEEEKQLTIDLKAAQANFRAALCDSFNTPLALQQLLELTTKANVYLQLKRRNLSVALTIADWMGRMLRMFGLGEGDRKDIGWGLKDQEGGGADRETLLMPYLRVISAFRDEVRKLSISKADPKDILALSDRLRDYDLAELGVALDDTEAGRALVKLVPAETLIEARETKLALARQKAAQQAANKEAQRVKQLAKMEKAKVPASEMFRPPNVPEKTYSAWDDKGIPTLDGEGVEISKAKSKKLVKEYDNQVKGNAEYQKWVAEQEEA